MHWRRTWPPFNRLSRMTITCKTSKNLYFFDSTYDEKLKNWPTKNGQFFSKYVHIMKGQKSIQSCYDGFKDWDQFTKTFVYANWYQVMKRKNDMTFLLLNWRRSWQFVCIALYEQRNKKLHFGEIDSEGAFLFLSPLFKFEYLNVS